MTKIKYTKNELKKQKDQLKVFSRYLPMLILKKQQLQHEIIKIRHAIDDNRKEKHEYLARVKTWVGVFAEPFDLDSLVAVKTAVTDTGNIAGIDIPIYKDVVFEEAEYDLFGAPLWVDYGIEAVKALAIFDIKKKILEKQKELIREELRVTTQRVNLFEKIKIPEARENIRKIRIALGDLQTAAVVTGKIAKRKIEAYAERERREAVSL